MCNNLIHSQDSRIKTNGQKQLRNNSIDLKAGPVQNVWGPTKARPADSVYKYVRQIIVGTDSEYTICACACVCVRFWVACMKKEARKGACWAFRFG
jgi:hypothetical protein